MPFLRERPLLAADVVWRASLVAHVGAGLTCLASSVLQFSQGLLRRAPRLHRVLGRVYVASVLLVASPTGFYLAFHAKGGPSGLVGFLLLGALTVVSTWKGVTAIRTGRRAAHVAWMIRAHALVTTAITFRIILVIGVMAGFDTGAVYVAALWLSLFGNTLVAEAVIHWRRQREEHPASLAPSLTPGRDPRESSRDGRRFA